MADWPGRGNRGSGSVERRNAEKLKKNSSMTKVASEAGIFSDEGSTHTLTYDAKKDRMVEVINDDLSYTKRANLRILGDTLLTRGNPFKDPKAGREGLKVQRGKRTSYPDLDFSKKVIR